VSAALVASVGWGVAFFILGCEFSSHFSELEAYLRPAGYAIAGLFVLLAGAWIYLEYVGKPRGFTNPEKT
jgi:membrane protein DedA with SNARE-associated domain